MIYQITYTKDGNGRNKKVARPVKDRAELMALRNSKENLELLAKARQGDGEAKAKLLQLAYNIGHVNGCWRVARVRAVSSSMMWTVMMPSRAKPSKTSF